MAKSRKPKRQNGRTKNQNSGTAKTAAKESKLSKSEQFRLEYAYVFKDLRTVFILAAIMFALLIVLNLILQ